MHVLSGIMHTLLDSQFVVFRPALCSAALMYKDIFICFEQTFPPLKNVSVVRIFQFSSKMESMEIRFGIQSTSYFYFKLKIYI